MADIIFSEGSGLQDSIFGKSQEPIRMLIEKRAEEFERKSVLPQMFNMMTSDTWAEKFTEMTTMKGPQVVGENGAYPTDGMQEGNSLVAEHSVWKDAFSISREIMDDNKILNLKSKPQGLVSAYYRTREKFGAAMYGAAIKGAGSVKFNGGTFSTKVADGRNLFDTAHINKGHSVTQTNKFADAFSNDALLYMEERMQNFTDHDGNILAILPDTIMIPNLAPLKKAVFAAIGADKDPDTANNGFNINFGRWNVVINPYLNQFITQNSAPWILMASEYNNDYIGAFWLDRVKAEIRSELEGNDANTWKLYSRFTAGFFDWRFAAVAGVAGGDTLVPGE